MLVTLLKFIISLKYNQYFTLLNRFQINVILGVLTKTKMWNAICSPFWHIRAFHVKPKPASQLHGAKSFSSSW